MPYGGLETLGGPVTERGAPAAHPTLFSFLHLNAGVKTEVPFMSLQTVRAPILQKDWPQTLPHRT